MAPGVESRPAVFLVPPVTSTPCTALIGDPVGHHRAQAVAVILLHASRVQAVAGVHEGTTR